MNKEELIKKYKDKIKEQEYIIQNDKIVEKYPLNNIYKEFVKDLENTLKKS
jgi:hypothetical protein